MTNDRTLYVHIGSENVDRDKDLDITVQLYQAQEKKCNLFLNSNINFRCDTKTGKNNLVYLDFISDQVFSEQFGTWINGMIKNNSGLTVDYSPGLISSMKFSNIYQCVLRELGQFSATTRKSAQKIISTEGGVIEAIVGYDPKGTITSKKQIADILRQGVLCSYLLDRMETTLYDESSKLLRP